MFNDIPRPVRLLIGIFFLLVTFVVIYIIAKGFIDGELSLRGRRGLWQSRIVTWNEHPIGFCALAFGYTLGGLMSALVSFGGFHSFLDD